MLAGARADEPNPKPARPAVVKVSGFGFLGNREMVRLLRNFQTNQVQPMVLGRTFVEDAALVLLARLSEEGYLTARLSARFTLFDGTEQTRVWTNAVDAQLPGDFAARAVRFRAQHGRRFYYQSIEVRGAHALTPAQARRHFISGDTLLKLRSSRIYSPARLSGVLAALQDALFRKGYRDASVTAPEVSVDGSSGAARVTVQIEEGLQSVVQSLRVEVDGAEFRSRVTRAPRPAEPYSPLWEQDFARRLRDEQYARGYPDAQAEIVVIRRETNAPQLKLDLLARVRTGPQVHLGHVRFEGNRHTKTTALARFARLEPGALLNRLQAEQARQRLARLGVFDWVALRYDATEADTRDAVYELQEAKSMSLNFLAGYGSYELLRGGLEFEHRNVLGLAHTVRLRGLQSFKASNGDLLYTVPEFLGDHVNLFGSGSGLRREEVSFTREEYGGAVGVQRRLARLQGDLSVRYDYEFLKALNLGATPAERVGVTEARAAAFVIDLNRDRRDNPLLPHQGLKLFSNLELASSALGGNVNYQRLLLAVSSHHPLGGGRVIHLGLTHGLTLTEGGAASELPFNKRFFPGGENSVRGYQQGEASPLDAKGKQLGAETFTQGNAELEQLLTPTWSVVGFFDAVGFAQNRSNYPWDEGLYSAGGGIRWRTLIGPARLEYGHNLRRRHGDPSGTLHFSIGFPF